MRVRISDRRPGNADAVGAQTALRGGNIRAAISHPTGHPRLPRRPSLTPAASARASRGRLEEKPLAIRRQESENKNKSKERGGGEGKTGGVVSGSREALLSSGRSAFVRRHPCPPGSPDYFSKLNICYLIFTTKCTS